MKTEKILIAIAVIAELGRIVQVPGGSMVLVLVLSSLSLMYLVGAFYFLSDGDLKRQNLPLSITWGLFLGSGPIAILFKLMWWPGANMMLISTIVPAVIFLIVVLILMRNNQAELARYYQLMALRTGVLLAITVCLSLTSSANIIKLHRWKDPQLQYLELRHFSDRNNDSITRALMEYQEKRIKEKVKE